jgi:chaperonin cofactor prefoldin
MQQDPLLEQLDWCFTSINWISDYPNTLLLPLAKTSSDHVPCMVQIGTSIPKAQLFRFENHWVDQPDFIELVQTVWNAEVGAINSVTRVTSKFKLLRRVLRKWGQSLSKLKSQLQNCNSVLAVMDRLEENRPLALQEGNFRTILKKHISKLMQRQKEYWKKRYTVRWTKFGDENTKKFMLQLQKDID